MITPNDIETKVFSSSLRGYNKREVDEFLDQIMIDYQALLDQNEKMLERVHVLQKQVAEAKDPARMTQDAKRLMNDISASAEQKAEVIIQNAKHDAANIVRNAKDSTSQADEDAERLRRKVEKFKLRFKEMLEEEIDRVDDNSEDLLDDLRNDFYPTLLYGEKEPDATKVAGGTAEEEDPIAELPDVEPTGDIVPEEETTEAELDEATEAAAEAVEEAEEITAAEEAEEEQEETEEAAKETEEAAEEIVEEVPEEAEAAEAEEDAEEPAEEPVQTEEPEAAAEGPLQTEEPAEEAAEEEPEEAPEEQVEEPQGPQDEFEAYEPKADEEVEIEAVVEEEPKEESGVTDKTIVIDDPLLAKAKEANVNVDDLPGFRSSINSSMDDTIVMKRIRTDKTVDITDDIKKEDQ